MKTSFRSHFIFRSSFPTLAASLLLVLAASIKADVVINEIYSFPRAEPSGTLGPLEDPALEFVELHNPDSQPAELRGWSLSGGVDYTFRADFPPLAPGGYLVIAANPAAFSAGNPSVSMDLIVGGWAGQLRNSGETIRLRDEEGTVVDEVAYADEGDWAVRIPGPLDLNHRGWIWSAPHDGSGHSLELVRPDLDNALGLAWAPSAGQGGSPGRANDSYSASVAPLISSPNHQPVVPSSADPIFITARVQATSESELTVLLHWRIDGEIAFRTALMTDDGTLGDGDASDGLFGAVIPPQADRTVIEFFIEARHAGRPSRLYPSSSGQEGSPTPNFLLQVFDGFAAHAAQGETPSYLLTLTEVERAELQTIGIVTAETKSNAQMNATFISSIGGRLECRYNIGVRNRGLTSRFMQPNSYRVNFRSDDPWHGLAAITLTGRDGYRAIAGHRFYQLAGLPASDALAVRLRVNGADLSLPGDPSYGHYAQVEVFDGDYADNHFPTDDQGNLYSVIWRGLAYRDDIRLYRNYYEKQTNSAEQDFTDVQRLGDVLANSPDETFLSDFAEVVDVDQWLRFFAVNAFLNNRESAITRGEAEDFALYRGVHDARFVLLPKDLDSVLLSAPGVSLFAASEIPEVKRFLEHPALVPRYYAHIRTLADTVFAPASFDRELERMLGSTVPASALNQMKSMLRQRRSFVLSVIPSAFQASTNLPVINGLPETSEPIARLTGTADAAAAFQILVNGSPASYSPMTGEWTHDSVTLFPGENHLLVQSVDEAGQEIERTSLLVRRETGFRNVLPSQIRGAVTLRAEEGPYHVVDSVVVAATGTLTIEPGTTLYFDPARSLVVVGGTIVARGTDTARIQFTRSPTEDDALWNRLNISSASQGNMLAHIDVRFAGWGGTTNFYLSESEGVFDNITFRETAAPCLFLTRPQLIVRNCDFPELTGKQTVVGNGLAGDQYLIFEGNTFGGTTGYNDIFDWTGGKRPGPILQFYDNTFFGGSDEALDLDGIDAHIEGNRFFDIRKNNQSTSTANAISTGGHDGIGSDLTVVRNVFDGCDHALLLKDGSTAVFEQNTVTNSLEAALNFGEPERRTGYAKGAVIRGSLFHENPAAFLNLIDEVSIKVDQSNLPAQWHSLGFGNIEADPLFVDPANRDFRLRPGSPATGTGPLGLDMGAHVPAGVRLAGEPPPLTGSSNALITVGGPGIVSYRHSLDGQPYGDETLVDVPITLENLADGAHQVRAIGKNSAGRWQSEDEAFISRTWTVDSQDVILLLNEVYAASGADSDDFVELVNHGATDLSLEGWSLSDDPSNPGRFTFLEGLTLGAGQLLTIAGGTPASSSEMRLGFQFAAEGETVRLFDPQGNEVDTVAYGLQAPGFSVGRNSAGNWSLCTPTAGSLNSPVLTGPPSALRISEWLAGADILVPEDYLELYNPLNIPIALSGLHLTDRPSADPLKRTIPALSFIGPQGYAVFAGDDRDRPDSLGFALSAEQGWVGLTDSQGGIIDQAFYFASPPDTPEGRTLPSSDGFSTQSLPTPGQPNILPPAVNSLPLLTWDALWNIEDSGAAPSTDWKEPDFDDSGWFQASGIIVRGEVSVPEAIGHALEPESNITTYFRTRFLLDGEPDDSFLRIRFLAADGAAFYLNGEEIHRLNLPEGELHPGTHADAEVALIEDVEIQLPASFLVARENVLAVEVHQALGGEGTLAMGIALDLVEETPAVEFLRPLLEGLRITEIHYHPDDADGDTEFVELRNIGDSPLELEGVRFTEGIRFTFPPHTLLPGERLLVARDPADFAARYGVETPVLGPYDGSLANGGETLALLLPEPWNLAILRFSYEDDWYRTTDGGGMSLEARWPYGPAQDWDRQVGWKVSSQSGGSPGMPILSSHVSGGIVPPGGQRVIAAEFLDEGLPSSLTGRLHWTQLEGPALAQFADPTAAETHAVFPLPGLYRLAVSLDDTPSALTAADFLVMETWEDWLSRLFTSGQLNDPDVSGDQADPDGDGLPNLVEFALGLEPLVAGDTCLRLEQTSGGPAALIRRPQWVTGIHYAVEWSSSLQDWLPSEPAVPSFRHIEAGLEEALVYPPVSILGASAAFARLHVRRSIDSTSTTVTGRIVSDLGDPLESAAIRIPFSTLDPIETDADGRFTIRGLPLPAGPLRLSLSVLKDGQYGHTALSLDPVAGGVTNAGETTLALAPLESFDLAFIPAGTFQMGDHFADRYADELPVHTVYISNFLIGQYEVTQGLWDSIREPAEAMGYNFERPGIGREPDHPVDFVFWFDMVKWCNARSEIEGREPVYYLDPTFQLIYRTGRVFHPIPKWTADGYRLPTEAEWEKAARGGLEGKRFPWGDTITQELANYSSERNFPEPYDLNPTPWFHPLYYDAETHYGAAPVGSFAPNGYGLYDVAGNVREYVWDWNLWTAGNYYEQSPSVDPKGPPSGVGRIVRSGRWHRPASHSRVSDRHGHAPVYLGALAGFRYAISIDTR